MRSCAKLAFVALALALACAVAVGRAADKEQKASSEEKPAHEAPYLVGDMRVRTMMAVTYGYVETETTFEKLGAAIGEAMPRLQKASESGKAKIAGPFVLVYPKGAHKEPDKPFVVQIGFLVADGATGDGDVKVRKTEPFKCATVLYTGPAADQGQAYQKLLPAIAAASLAPTGEEREFTIYFESVESPNNVVLIQVGVK